MWASGCSSPCDPGHGRHCRFVRRVEQRQYVQRRRRRGGRRDGRAAMARWATATARCGRAAATGRRAARPRPARSSASTAARPSPAGCSSTATPTDRTRGRTAPRARSAARRCPTSAAAEPRAATAARRATAATPVRPRPACSSGTTAARRSAAGPSSTATPTARRTPDCPAGQVCGGNGMAEPVRRRRRPDGGANCTPKTCAQLGYDLRSRERRLRRDAQLQRQRLDDHAGLPARARSAATAASPTSAVRRRSRPVATAAARRPSRGTCTTRPTTCRSTTRSSTCPPGSVQTPPTGSTATCGCTSQPAFVSTFTGIDGSFTLANPPTGSSVTIVVQLGKWQRVFTESITACQTNTLASHLTLPSTRAQGNIPRFAIDTGASRRDGVRPPQDGRRPVGVRRSEHRRTACRRRRSASTCTRARISAVARSSTPTRPREKALTENATTLDSYDVALFPCQGAAGTYNAAHGYPNTLANLVSYTDAGGRMFATHYHYDLLHDNGASRRPRPGTRHTPTTAWGTYYGDTKFNSDINQTFATGATLAKWLNQPIVYGGTLGSDPGRRHSQQLHGRRCAGAAVALARRTTPRRGTARSRAAPARTCRFTTRSTRPSRRGADGTCGRVVYSDFHVESQPSAAFFTGDTFPTECPGGTAPTSMTPQEELLEFMLFDLTSCVAPPTCTPLTCANYPTGTCGQQSDGCGGLTANCGTCMAPQTCGGGGTPNMCGAPDAGSCTPMTCAGSEHRVRPRGQRMRRPPPVRHVPERAASASRGSATPLTPALRCVRRRRAPSRASSAASPATAAATSSRARPARRGRRATPPVSAYRARSSGARTELRRRSSVTDERCLAEYLRCRSR